MIAYGADDVGWVRLAVWTCAGVVVLLTALVVVQAPALVAVDHAVSGAAYAYGVTRPDWVAVLSALTWLGSGWLLIPAGLVLAAVLARRGRPAAALVVVAGLAGAQLTQWLMKALVGRQRPADPLGDASWYGYASGHAQNAATAALLLAVVCWPVVTHWRRAVLATAVVVWIGLVGFTRVALVVHWPSDVLAGWALGGLVVAGTVTGLRRLGLSSTTDAASDQAAQEGDAEKLSARASHRIRTGRRDASLV